MARSIPVWPRSRHMPGRRKPRGPCESLELPVSLPLASPPYRRCRRNRADQVCPLTSRAQPSSRATRRTSSRSKAMGWRRPINLPVGWPITSTFGFLIALMSRWVMVAASWSSLECTEATTQSSPSRAPRRANRGFHPPEYPPRCLAGRGYPPPRRRPRFRGIVRANGRDRGRPTLFCCPSECYAYCDDQHELDGLANIASYDC